MIPQISEIHFPSYATLHEATVTLVDMGERTVETQIRIDGDTSPIEMGVTENGQFLPMEVEFKGERFVLPVREPQASKDNSTRNALVDVTFRSWPIEELKRYFFFTIDPPYTGTAVPDKYEASVRMSLVNFVKNFRRVLQYYWPDNEIQIDLYQENDTPSPYGNEEYLVEISYAKVWDVLTKFYEIFGKRWSIETRTSTGTTKYVIKVNYPTDSQDITDHTFHYGFEGGLLRFERQVQDEDITNILLGRGGEKNLPYRYFKLVDPQNPSFRSDPDAIPELANIYFDRLHDITFRWYVRGWMQNTHRDTSWDATHTFPDDYEESDIPAGEPLHSNCLFAFRKGRSDERFEPIEYVTDKLEYISPDVVASGSIAKYGEHWGALDDMDDIYPTIQGRSVSPYGRIDEVVDVAPITTDNIQEAAEESAIETSIKDVSLTVYGNARREFELYSAQFTIPTDRTGDIQYKPFSNFDEFGGEYSELIHYDTDRSTVVAVSESTGVEYPINAIPAGTYHLKLNMVIWADPSLTLIWGTFGIQSIVLYITALNSNAWKPTFDIWVKNIWNTDRSGYASDIAYAEAVWLPILGDHLGKEASLIFADGPMSGADYEFVIASIPVYDTSHLINGVPSEWRITLYKSSAEYDATGLFIPNSQVKPVQGNHFYFIGIDMPHYYVELAEQELDVTKTAHLSTVRDIAPTWVVSLDKVRVHSAIDQQEVTLLADRLKTGIKVPVSDSRFLPTPLDLFIQSITFRWQEPTNESPYIVPDIEVVLSDKVVPQESTISRIEGQISSIHSEYVRADMVEEIVRRIASSLYLKKTGESDVSQSPTQFASKVTSSGFEAGGVGGQGWGIYRSNIQAYSEGEVSEGDTVIETDRLIVRKELEVNSLVVNQISAQSGKEILSAARIEVTKVIYDSTGGTYKCYFDQRRGSVANTFVVGDVALCQRYDSEWDTTPTKYYRMVVSEVGLDFIALTIASNDGTGTPAEGDVIVQFGHVSNPARQYAIVRDVVGGGYEQMLCALRAVAPGGGSSSWAYTSGKEYYFAGKQNSADGPRWFIGDRSRNQYIEYVNDHLTIKGSASVEGVGGSTLLDGDIIQTGEIVLGQQTAASSIMAIFDSLGNVYSVDDNDGQLNYKLTRIAGPGPYDYLYSDAHDPEDIPNDYIETEDDYSHSIQLVLTYGSYTPTSTQLRVLSGISGRYTAGVLGGGIAAWYGGEKVDHEASPSLGNYAKTVFRFDGSGYLASGRIYWNASGYGGIPGITWSEQSGQNVVTIGANVKLASVDGDTVTDLLNAVNSIKEWFGEDANGDIYIKKRTVGASQIARGLYGYSFITAGGENSAGGGGGATTLGGLSDVSLVGTLVAGQVLAVGAGGDWTNKALGPADIFPGLTGNPSVGQTVVWTNDNGNLHWAYGAAGGGGTYTAGTGLDLTNGQFSINNTYQGYISNGNTAYGWGNHAEAGYLTSVPDISGTYLKYFGWTAPVSPDTNPDANKLTWGSYIYGDSTANRPSNTNGALIAFGQAAGTRDYGPAQIVVDHSGLLHTRIYWYDGTWRGWHSYVTIDTNQTITGTKTFASHIVPSVPSGTTPSYNLGTNEARWANIYAVNCNANTLFVAGQASNSGELVRFGENGQLVTSGLSYNDIVTLSGNQTITGLKTFANNILPDEARSRQLGSDSLFWKSLYAEDLYVKGFVALRKDGDTYASGAYSDGGFHFYARNSSGTWIEGLRVMPTETVVCAHANNTNLRPDANGTKNLGAPDSLWNNFYAKKWYPVSGNSSLYVEWDSTTDSFRFHGNITATGQITAGVDGSGSAAFPTEVSGSLVPTTSGYNIGSAGVKFNILYVNEIGASDNLTPNIYAANVNVGTKLTAAEIEVTDLKNYADITALMTSVTPTSDGANLGSNTSVIANILTNILSGKISRFRNTTTSSTYIGTANKRPGFYEIVKVEQLSTGTTPDYRICFGTTLRLERVSGTWKYYNTWA